MYGFICGLIVGVYVAQNYNIPDIKENTTKYEIGLMQKKRSPEENLNLVIEHKIPISQIRWRTFSENDYVNLKKAGAKSYAFYVDDLAEIDYIQGKVDGILTNYPSVIGGYLKMKKE